MAQKVRTCETCGEVLHGRIDKRFCSDECRSTYHNRKNLENNQYINKVNNILKKNRKILEDLNTDGKAKVARKTMIRKGFQFDFHTHHYTTKQEKTYYFCYEHGYLQLSDDLFMLVINDKFKELL